MGLRNDSIENGNIMNGIFCVKDSLKGRAGRKSDVILSCEKGGLARLQMSSLESEKPGQDVEKILEQGKWLVYFTAESAGQSAALQLVKTCDLTECMTLEAINEHIPVLKMMAIKLREHLKVISYDVKMQDLVTKNKPTLATLHIMRDRVAVILGSPPHLKNLLDYSFGPFENGITLSADNKGLKFAALPNVMLLSEHKDEIWQTLQGCMQAVRACAGAEMKDERTEYETMPGRASTKTQYVYYNLPTRPCKYLYMNLPDQRRAPRYRNHDYINVFHAGSIYSNWRSCTTKKNKDPPPTESDLPPPPPPRLRPPPLPPKPMNRPPNSPLPPLPKTSSLLEPPSLPLPRLPERYLRKEIEFVVYSSKPVTGQMFVIQVVFFQKNDSATLQRIKKLEEEANYQVLKPLPDCISVGGDLRISLYDIDECCTLKSDRHQVIEYEIVKEAILQSCWLIIEFHLEHNDSTRRNFHGKIIMRPKGSKSTSARSSKEIQISTTFQEAIQNGLHQSLCHTTVCNSLKSIGVRRYLEVCSLMDIPCALHNDWTGLASEVGLSVDEVFKIQSKASFPNFSPTNEVINIWSQRQNKSCNVEQFKIKLQNLQRFDVLSVLEEC